MTEEEVSQAELQELSLLLENRAFVDYFNVFLSLPVFGQHVFYNYVEAEFKFEPPIKQRRHLYLDRREILKWLYHHRLRLFRRSPLYTEFMLCSKLRSLDIPLAGLKESDENGEDRKTFTRNLMGTATGMMLFRESMRGTCGEYVYRCWKDIESWRLIEDPIRKMFWKNAIRTKYISQSSTAEVKGKIKFLVYQGVLNFDLVPEDAAQQTVMAKLLSNDCLQSMESDNAMLQLQTLLLSAMQSYWVPRHLLHVLNSVSQDSLKILIRPAPGDIEYLSHERRLRCRFMFPTIYQDSTITSPATTVFVSKSAGDLPMSVTPEEIPEEEHIDHVDLFTLWTGPARDIVLDPASPSASYSSSILDHDSLDDVSKRHMRSAYGSQIRHVRSPIPITLTSYLGGKKRTLLGRFPKTTHRIIWSLASDVLASFPFRNYLEQNGQTLDLSYLSFWTDVRNYLDTDESAMDCFGHPLRRLLAHRLVQSYLSKTGESCDIFSETLKMSLFQAILNNNDVSLLCMAQDIIQESLWEPLKLYIEDERKGFLKQVRGKRYDLALKKRQRMDCMATAKRTKSACSLDSDMVDTVCFFDYSMTEMNTMTSPSSPAFGSPLFPSTPAISRPNTSYHISITEEQMWKAMEIAVLCCEYGTSMMIPQTTPKLEDLVDILHSDYGSLHVSRVPAVRHEWLRSLMHKPKINIDTIRVSRKVIVEEVDIKKLEKDDPGTTRQRNRLVIRRNGLILDRPQKPKSFIEVLTNPQQYEFFKRFILAQKAGLPLSFWKTIEDLKDLSNAKTRQIRVTQIMRKFFGKYAKYGASLDCHEEIIRQIPNMEKVTPGILICAQAAIYRSMERKWFPQYLDTYPPESDTSDSPNVINSVGLTPKNTSPELVEIVHKAKKPKRRANTSKTLQLWKNATKALVEFCRAIASKAETQLLDFFLKCEVEKEQSSTTKENVPHPDKNVIVSHTAANLQTRVVIRNRLVIMNRLPQDLRFWIEVRKYQDIVDSSSMKGSMSAQDTEFLCDKARSVIACYLQSDVPPKVQVNIPNDMALLIINGLASGGPTRGLFHDAVILLFPLLYHFWRKFTDEWMNGDIPDDYIDTIERTFRDKVSKTPHGDMNIPTYTNITDADIKTSTQSMMEDIGMRIHFSLADGVSFIYNVPRQMKSNTHVTGRRMTKHSLNALNEEISPRRESRAQTGVGGDRRESRRSSGIADDGKRKVTPQKERKKAEKIHVKELDKKVPSNSNLVGKRSSMDKARRLSQLVESLNREREEKIKEQNKKYSKIMSFEQVVQAAMKELSDSNSVFS